MANRILILKRTAFALVFLAVVALSVAIAAMTSLREISNILLFIPLFWAAVSLPAVWTLVCIVILACCRFGLELLNFWQSSGTWDFYHAAEESVWPVALYVVVGLVVYGYRRRQARLVSQLVESGTQEARHRLTSSLTHDFGNILTVILGTSDMLLRDTSLDEKHRRDIESILKAGREGQSLMEQLRGASRGGQANLVPLDFGQLVDAQLDLVQKLLPPYIHVLRHTTGQLPVQADKGQILRVLMNLCLNARDAMPKGGVLTVQTGAKTIRGVDYAFLAVSDSGPGIDPGALDRVFDPFFTTKADSGNVGLGLSIVRSIASSHSGTVQARNVPGSGASFTFMIPLATGPKPPTPPPYRPGEA